MLRPCKQWICDSCSELIVEAKHGYLEWLTLRDGVYRVRDFRIVHQPEHSPFRDKVRGRNSACNQHQGQPERSCVPLDIVLGPDGMQYLLEIVQSVILNGVFLKNGFRSWLDAFRRLHVPNYEEARHGRLAACGKNVEAGLDDLCLCSQQRLHQIIAKYPVSLVHDSARSPAHSR